MPIFLIIAGLLFLAGIVLLIIWFIQQKSFGVLKGRKIYTDTQKRPGEVLYSKTLPLAGRPDYIIAEGDMVFPVEVKSGKTPSEPYSNHTMQLMTYCFLVEENYGVRPIGGYLKYPEKEFKIAFTDEAKEAVRNLVKKIYNLKVSGKEQYCKHPEHN